MSKALCAVCLWAFVFYAQGLDFTLHRSNASGNDLPCAVLTCEDHANVSRPTTTSAKDLTSPSKQRIKTWSSISVFKKVGSSSNKNIDIREEVLIESAALGNFDSFNGNTTNADTYLGSDGGVVKVEFYRQEDCEAEFTCVVRGLDKEGREVMETASLPEESNKEDTPEKGKAMRSILLDSFRSIIVHMSGIEDKIGARLRDLSQKVDSFRKAFDTRCTEIERSIRSVQQELSDNTNRHVDSAKRDVHMKHDILKSLRNISEGMRQEQRTAIEKIAIDVEQSLNNTNIILSSVENNFDELKSLTKENMVEVRNKTEALHDVWVASIDNHGYAQNESEKAELQLPNSNVQETSDLKTMFAQLIASNACEKGMMAFMDPSFPYPVTYPKNTLTFPYPCDTTTDGGGWIIIQRRAIGNVDFNRKWDDYKKGFGTFNGDFWLGNDNIYTITASGNYELRIDLVFDGESVYAHYDSFSIQSESYTENTDRYRSSQMGYKLSIGAYNGTAGDSLRDNDGRPFSTSDQDHDNSGGNCAEEYQGGWWFVGCGYTCLNGEWGATSNKGMEWRDLTGGPSVSFSEMKIRRVS